jgi:hypothetical protein
VRREGPSSRKDRLDWLHGEYGLEPSEAEAVVVRADRGESVLFDDSDGLIPELFTGDAAEARPLFDRLVAILRAFGKDGTARRSMDSVIFYRNWVIAAAKPVEDGLLAGAAIPGGVEVGDRMERVDGSEGFPKRITHTVFIGIMDEFTGEVAKLFREAYDAG